MHQTVLHKRRAVGEVLGAAAALTTLTGCGASQGQVAAAHSAPAAPAARATVTATTTAAATTPTQKRAAQAALAAYEASWRVMDEVGRAGHYQFAVLSSYFTGSVLKTITQNLDVYEKNGIVSKGAIVLHPVVSVVNLQSKPPSVTIADCVDDRKDLLYYAATGKPIDNVPGGFRAETAVMSDLNGTWKETDQVTDAVGTCKPW